MKTEFYDILLKLQMSLFFTVFPFVLLSAQNCTVAFSYDASGNRILRTIDCEKMRNQGDPVADFQPVNESEEETVPTGRIEELTINVFPNPTESVFYVETMSENRMEKKKAILSTVAGTKVSDTWLKEAKTAFDLSEQPAGVYLLDLFLNEEHLYWKIIKY